MYCLPRSKWLTLPFTVAFGLCINQVSANSLVLASMAEYHGCSYTDNGNGTSNLRVDIVWKEAKGNFGEEQFKARAIMIYAYNETGKPIPGQNSVRTLNIGGSPSDLTFTRADYSLYTNVNSSYWNFTGARSSTVFITIDNSVIKQWPAVAVRAGHYTVDKVSGTSNYDFGEIRGVRYIPLGSPSNRCKTVADPALPPPPEDLNIRMSAPDWHLGELQRGGETEKNFPALKDQLCLDYKGSNFINYQEYLIKAASRNGPAVNNRYLLKHTETQAPGLPYYLTLDDGSKRVVLPSGTQPFKLNKNGKTCFVPTFKVFTEKNVKSGRYDDVLTFDIISKP